MFGYAVMRSSTVQTGTQYIEMGDESKFKLMAHDDGNAAKITLKGNVNIANYLGLSPSATELEADIGANPSEEVFLHLFVYSINNAFDPGAVNATVTMSYNTKFREKTFLSLS